MTIPLVDWSAAPDWAKYHVFQPWGEGYWGEAKPDFGIYIHNRGRWWFGPAIKYQASGYELPLGQDHRVSLEERPVPENPDNKIEMLYSQISLLRLSNDILRAELLEIRAKQDGTQEAQEL